MGRHRLAAAGLLSALALAAPAAAQDVAAAEALFNRGLADMQAGQFETGCPALGESYRLDPRLGALFTLAECEARRGRIASAVSRYGDYLALFSRLSPEAQAQQKGREKIAANKRAELTPVIPELTLSLPKDAPHGTMVKRGDELLSDAALGVAQLLDPGEYVVTTQAPGGPVTELRVTIAKGDKQQITLEVKPPASVTPDAAPPSPHQRPESGSKAWRTGAFIAGGVGAAGLVAGAITGGYALAQKGVVAANCNQGFVCNRDGKLAADRGKMSGWVSTISFGVGLAGVGTAVVLWLTAPSPPPLMSAEKYASARKVNVSVWAAGREAGGVELQGVW
jgi:hypothetical protein